MVGEERRTRKACWLQWLYIIRRPGNQAEAIQRRTEAIASEITDGKH